MAFTDDFLRDDETLEDSADWTLIGGSRTAAVISNECVIGSNGTDSLYLCPDQGSANHYSQVVRVTSTSLQTFMISVRVVDVNNFAGAVRSNGGAWQVYKIVTGSFTLLGSYTSAPVGGEVLYLEANSDDEITLKIDATLRVGPVTVAEHTAATRQGIGRLFSNAVCTLDDFEAAALAAAAGNPYYAYAQQ